MIEKMFVRPDIEIKVTAQLSSAPYFGEQNLVYFSLKVFPLGWSKNDAAAVISKVQQIEIGEEGITSDNVLRKFIAEVFMDSIDDVEYWLASWGQVEYKDSIIRFFREQMIP